MAKTSALIELEARIRTIEVTLLPKINPLGIYTDAEQDSIRAFVLLCHAEIESFIEDWARILLDALLLELLSPRAGSLFARAHAIKVSASLPHTISGNHGIKADNILKMFEPLGLVEPDFDAIDSKFLTQMNAFGSRRGESAHCSANRAKQQPSPIKEKKAVDEILLFLEKFETALIQIRLAGFLTVR